MRTLLTVAAVYTALSLTAIPFTYAKTGTGKNPKIITDPFTRKLKTVKAAPVHFNSPGKYLEYKRKQVMEGKDSARAFVKAEEKMMVEAWPHSATVSGDGVMEIGKYIDFHESSDDASDFSYRLTSWGGILNLSGAAVINGNLTATVGHGGYYNLVTSGGDAHYQLAGRNAISQFNGFSSTALYLGHGFSDVWVGVPDISGNIVNLKVTGNVQAGNIVSSSLTSKGVIIKNNGDNVVFSEQGSNIYSLIGTYAGWDQNAAYIAGYNNSNNNTSPLHKVYVGGPNGNTFLFDMQTGRMGIGTSPQAKLHVKNGAIMSSDVNYDNINVRMEGNSLPAIRFSRWDGGTLINNAFVGQFNNLAAAGEYSFGIGTGKAASDQNATSNVLTVTMLGKVGIGTVNPAGKLEVSEFGANSQVWPLVVNNPDNNMTFPNFTSAGVKFKMSGTGESDKWAGIAGVSEAEWSNRLGLAFYTGVGGQQERMRISNDGNVGIGTTTPKAVLDVNKKISGGALGTILARQAEGDGVGDGTFLGVRAWATQVEGAVNYYGKSFSLEHSFYGLKNSAINFYRGGDMTGGYMTFETNNGQEQMRIKSDGHIGINTTDPGTYHLAVNGDIKARKLKITVTDWPDYVFAPAYKLLSLKEVENYINQYKHLPGIASADEIAKDGLDVGDNQAGLLKKIEELTLYAIEQDKKWQATNTRNDKLEKENDTLKQRLDKIEKLLSAIKQ